MPYLHMRLSVERSPALARKAAELLATHTSRILGKRPEVTSISIDFKPDSDWFVGGASIEDQGLATFYLDIKITEGTNTKRDKAAFVHQVFADMQVLLGGITPASYIVVHEVRADAWGFGGRTQEHRLTEAAGL